MNKNPFSEFVVKYFCNLARARERILRFSNVPVQITVCAHELDQSKDTIILCTRASDQQLMEHLLSKHGFEVEVAALDLTMLA